MPKSTVQILKYVYAMLSGFELYSRWVPLKGLSFVDENNRLHIEYTVETHFVSLVKLTFKN